MYNELLLILMGFVVLMMIVMAVMVGTRTKKPAVKIIEEEPKPEKILVEKGFENHIKEPVDEPEEFDFTPIFIDEPPAPEVKEPEEEIEYTPVLIDELPAPEDEEPPSEILETEPTLEPEPTPEETEFDALPEETVEIPHIEPIIIEPTENEETALPNLNESPSIPELDMEVIITPNQTFYDPIPEEPAEETAPSIEDSPIIGEAVESEEHEVEDIPEIELAPLEPDEPEQMPEEIEAEIEEEPEPEPEIPASMMPLRRIRKPVIDESDPDTQIDLGIETCPHCGSKVPATIYCINCGKALDPNAIEQEEEIEEEQEAELHEGKEEETEEKEEVEEE